MKKVCIVLPPFFTYPTKTGCAVETLVTILGEKNKEQNKIDLDILSLKNNKTGIIKLNIIDKVLFLIYRVLKKIVKIDCFYLNRYYYKMFKRILKKNYDYVIFEAGSLNEYRILSKKLGKGKMIFHMHHNIEDEGEKEREIIVKTFGKFIGVSNFVINRLQEMYNIENENIKVLVNCTSEDKFQMTSIEERESLRTRLKIEKNDFVVLFVGRLIEEKGIYELVEAMKDIHEKKIKLLILGSTFSENSKDTDFSRKLKNSIKNFEENIIFTGYIPHDRIYEYYQIANIQVVPSTYEEAAGLVAIEGMLSGLPIIATKSGGMIEYIDEQCAKIIDKDENIIENLKMSILELYRDEEKRKQMSKHGMERAKKFTMQKYYDDFVKIIEE